jgi:hypothetical protein
MEQTTPTNGNGRTWVRSERGLRLDRKGRWWIDHYTPDGRRRRKIVGRSKSAARALLAKLTLDMARGEFVDPARSPSFARFCDIFMERHGRHKPGYR